MKIKQLTQIGLAVAAFAVAQTASAVVALTLTGPVAGNTVGPQSSSNPCIIAGTQCQQPASMGFNNFTSAGNIADYDMYSTTPTDTVADGVEGDPYTVAQLEGALGGESTFIVAIDVNTAGGAGGHLETLQLFEVIINGVVEFNYVGPTLIGGIANQGNGFGDWFLEQVDLSSFDNDATVLFHAVWTGATDGAESFFLVSGTPPTQIPEPGTTALLGLALAGLGLSRALKGRRARA